MTTFNIKQLQQNGETIAPQTVAEAVLVKQNEEIVTLDQLLKSNKIITPDGSGLITKQTDGGLIITHNNKIKENNTPEAMLIQHDENGHIILTKPMSKFKVAVNDIDYTTFDGNNDSDLKLGDDFTIDQFGKITLNWIEYGNT